jgi:Repeat of unknown function (DUF5648)
LNTIRVYLWLFLSVVVGSQLGCGESTGPASLGSESASVGTSKPIEKAAGDYAPVHRFAKISNGAYFYTANADEFEAVNASFPDFRYEGVAFQALTAGGIPVFRFAKTDTGAYFYTVSVEEKNTIQANFPNFRYEGEVFRVPENSGSPTYRLANLSNGAYLYTNSYDEYLYAQTVGFRGEGEKFKVPAGIWLSGTVFDGIPWDQATVKVTGASGGTRTVTTTALGSYSVDIVGLQAPIAVVASFKRPGSRSEFMTATLGTLPSNSTSATLNVTPLTSFVYKLSIGLEPAQLFANANATNSNAFFQRDNELGLSVVRKVFASQIASKGLSASSFDPMKLAFAANDSGQAALIRDTTVTTNGASSAWFASRLTGDQAGTSVYVNEVIAQTISTVPSIAAASKPLFPKSVLDSIKLAWNNCLAIPAAQRAVFNSTNQLVSLHPTCQAIASADYLQSGDSFGIRWRSILVEPSFVQGNVESVTFRDYVDLDGKELAGVFVRALSSDGKPYNSLEILRKVNGTWVVGGNQRPYTGSVLARYSQYSRVANGAAGEIDRFRTEIQFAASPEHPSMANIRSVRVKGPGLPSAGLVYMRSNVCGTSDYMTIQNKDGIVVDSASGVITADRIYTANSSPTFNLQQFVRAGSTTWDGTNRNFKTVQSSDIGAEIPPLSRYTMEYFSFGQSPSETPIATYTTTIAGTIFTPTSVAVHESRSAQFTTEFINDFLNPAANTGQLASVVSRWAVSPYAGVVGNIFGYSSSRNVAQPTTTAIDAFFVAQGGSTNWIPSAATSTTVYMQTQDFRNGVSTHPTTNSIAAANNPSCAAMPVAFRGLNEPSGYREMTLRTFDSNLTRIQNTKGIAN